MTQSEEVSENTIGKAATPSLRVKGAVVGAVIAGVVVAGAIVAGTVGKEQTAAAAPKDGGAAIRPFHVAVPDADLADLRRRLAATRWPEKETVADTSQGAQLAKLQALVHYWGKDYCVFRCIRSAVPGASDQDSGYPIRIRSEATSTGLVRRWVGSRVGVSDLSGGAWMSRAA